MDSIAAWMKVNKMSITHVECQYHQELVDNTLCVYCRLLLLLLKYFRRFHFTSATLLVSFASVKQKQLEDAVSLHCTSLLPSALVGRRTEEQAMTNCCALI